MDFPQLVDLHYRGLFQFALSLARSEADAADLTQETFLRWAEKGSQLRVSPALFNTRDEIRRFLDHAKSFA